MSLLARYPKKLHLTACIFNCAIFSQIVESCLNYHAAKIPEEALFQMDLPAKSFRNHKGDFNKNKPKKSTRI